MMRILWIVVLSVGLFFFGGWLVVIVIAGITHRHLNLTGVVMLICDAYAVWIILNYLRQAIDERVKPRIAHVKPS